MNDLGARSDDGFEPSASWDALQLRSLLLRRFRAFFDQRGFLEVSTPLLSTDTVIDRHLDPLCATLFDDPRRPSHGRRLYLQTSPEFHMKRLLASGGEAIYQVTRGFRGAETGKLHNPEFTIVEWYRRGDTMTEGIQLLDDLCTTIFSRGPTRRISYEQAFREHLGIDPHLAERSELVAILRSLDSIHVTDDVTDDRDALLDLLLAERVQPHLGRPEPTIVYDYPAGQAALARIRDGQPPVAERFELFVDGVELANGYHELLDPNTLRHRNRIVNQQRQLDGKPRLPEESRLLRAMEHGLPPCAGVALGFDRVVMLCGGYERLQEVIAFPIDRA